MPKQSLLSVKVVATVLTIEDGTFHAREVEHVLTFPEQQLPLTIIESLLERGLPEMADDLDNA